MGFYGFSRTNHKIFTATIIAISAWAILTVFPGIATAAPAWYGSSWSYRQSMTIDKTKVPSDQANFPVLIKLSGSAGLQANAQSDGDDILFTSDNGTSKLAHEIEKYVTGTGELVAWVNVPLVSSTADTTVYMYYGNPTATDQQNKTAVWDANFKLVQHLHESSGTHDDSTINSNDGTSFGVTPNAVGKIDGAGSFDGIDDYIDDGGSASLKLTLADNITVEAWVNPALDALNRAIAGNEWDDEGYHLRINNLNRGRFIIINDGSSYKYSDTSVLTAGWHHVVGIWDGSSVKTYLDGVLDSASSSAGTVTNITSVQNFWVGNLPGAMVPSGPFKGIIDEVRVSDTARSANWIATEYNNQTDPTFYSLGSIEEPPAPATGVNTSVLLTVAIGSLGAGVVLLRRRPALK